MRPWGQPGTKGGIREPIKSSGREVSKLVSHLLEFPKSGGLRGHLKEV